ncbi:hypothetical protein [[Limnothrix rosea] IAM M-220]|uniref:hypothetical protein n=1 Tax=[Limnothrix rosea] IAM M-220 TaxID=454133 RepID=UPI00095AA581|nr:hypothetical protein [[Limnothrix rosea] IAM M-220]OKH20016.1 hypothetical protein NIES208_00655 [[Limnothrix rosea] IAM M-220]
MASFVGLTEVMKGLKPWLVLTIAKAAIATLKFALGISSKQVQIFSRQNIEIPHYISVFTIENDEIR